MELVRGRTLDTVITHRGLPLETALRYARPDRRCARGGACRGHRPSRSQAGEHHGDRRRPDQDSRLRPRHPVRHESRAARLTRHACSRRRSKPVSGRFSARSRTCPRSRPRDGSRRAVRPLFVRRDLSTRCCRACARSRRRRRPTRSRPSSGASPNRWRSSRGRFPAAVDRLVAGVSRRTSTAAFRARRRSESRWTSCRKPPASGASRPPSGISAAGRLRAVVAAAVAAAMVAAANLVVAGAAPTAFSPVPLTALPGSESFPTFSPDGSQFAFTWLREGGRGYDVFAQTDWQRHAAAA